MNNKGADQPVHPGRLGCSVQAGMRPCRLGCAGSSAPLLFVYSIRQVFSRRGSHNVDKQVDCYQSDQLPLSPVR